VFAIGNRVEQPGCLVERVVNQSLGDALAEAEALLLARFAQVTLAELSGRFNAQYPKQGAHHAHPTE
jgi:ribosomal protein S3AE